MKNIKYILYIVAALFLSVSCKKDAPFVGSDAYLKSFSLTKDGAVYVASIVDKELKLSLPTNVDLSGATASYVVSELATISPDPATISDWDSAVEFTVTSHNGFSSRVYRYSVERSGIDAVGNYTITTQSQVDEFTQSGVTKIEGNLTIGESSLNGSDPITNLDALSSLEEVTGNVTIAPSYAGANLAGLSNLKTAANFYIGSATAAVTLAESLEVDLPALQSVAEFVVNSPSVTSISAASLQSVMNIYISGANIASFAMPALSSVLSSATFNNVGVEDISLPALENVGESFTVQSSTKVANLSLAKLESVGGNFTLNTVGANATALSLDIANLKEVGGQFALQTLAKLEELEVSSLQSVSSLLFQSITNVKSVNMSALKSVEGAFQCTYLNNCENFDISSLESIGGDMTVGNMGKLLEFVPSALKEVNGSRGINFTNCNAIQALEFPALTSCEVLNIYPYAIEDLDFSSITNLKNVSLVYINNLKHVKLPAVINDLTFNAASMNIPVPEVEGLEELSGSLLLTNFRTAVIDYPKIKKINTLRVQANSGLQTVNMYGIEEVETFAYNDYNSSTLNAPDLKKVTNFSMSDAWNLVNIDLSSLQEITELLDFRGASGSWNASRAKTDNFDFFLPLKKVGRISIQYCPKCKDFSAFKNLIPQLSADTWSVTNCGYNPTYQDMLDGKYIGS